MKTLNASIGVAPGDDNLFLQLYRQGLIEAPVVSFFSKPGRNKFVVVIELNFGFRMLIGDFSKGPACGEKWTHFKTISDTQWVVRAQRVSVGDFYVENARVKLFGEHRQII